MPYEITKAVILFLSGLSVSTCFSLEPPVASLISAVSLVSTISAVSAVFASPAVSEIIERFTHVAHT